MGHEWDYGFAVRTATWHRQEQNFLTDYPGSIDDALPLAFARRDGSTGDSLQPWWEPTKVPVFTRTLDGIDADGNEVWGYVEMESHRAIARDDDGTHLGMVGSDYEIITNREVMEIAEALTETDSAMKIDCAGSLRDGQQVFVTVLLDEPMAVGGDDTLTVPFFCVTSGHNGTAACNAGPAFIRVVCANTVKAAEMDWASGRVPHYTFRHTGKVADRIEEAKAAIAGLRTLWAEFQEISAELAAMPTTDEMIESFLTEFMPLPEAKEGASERQRNNVGRARGEWRSILEGPTCEGHADSALGLVDASVEWLEHYRTTRAQDTYVRRSLVSVDNLKTSAFRLAREVCTA
jgi:phage/plasmid-like protein (TIGR03299 family)